MYSYFTVKYIDFAVRIKMILASTLCIYHETENWNWKHKPAPVQQGSIDGPRHRHNRHETRRQGARGSQHAATRKRKRVISNHPWPNHTKLSQTSLIWASRPFWKLFWLSCCFRVKKLPCCGVVQLLHLFPYFQVYQVWHSCPTLLLILLNPSSKTIAELIWNFEKPRHWTFQR